MGWRTCFAKRGFRFNATGVVGNSFGIVGVTMLVAAVIAFTFPRLRKKEA